MKQYNLAQLVSDSQESFLSYLKSAMPIGNHANQRELGVRFSKLWESGIFKGPYVETIPSYERTKSLCQLQTQPTGLNQAFFNALQPKFSWRSFRSSFPLFRRFADQFDDGEEATPLHTLWFQQLYAHQLESLLRAGVQKRNLVIATGTGSGKTEAFLLPILHSILSESRSERALPGVRALLLYPMNALVEDQMSRLRRLLLWLNLRAFDEGKDSLLPRPITFGRYTGQTPVDARDGNVEREVSEDEIHELGEVRFRCEMQERPPDILVTNFTMLEYMLIRNDDRTIFQYPEKLKFLVLDEVHTYAGTRGMEVSTLLRRFRNFVGRNSKTPYQSLGTSATLGDTSDARQHMADFASALFGGPFNSEDIVLGRTERLRVSELAGISFSLDKILQLSVSAPKFCCAYGLVPNGNGSEYDEIPPTEWASVAEALYSDCCPWLDTNLERNEILGRIAGASRIVRRLVQAIDLDGGAVSLDDLVRRLSEAAPLNQGRLAVARLLQICVAGTVDGRCATSFRSHLFVREQRSAYLCINPGHSKSPEATDGWWSDLSFVHRTACACNGIMLPVYLCRKCGFVFLEAWLRSGRFYQERDELLGGNKFRRILLRPLASVSSEFLTEHTEELTLASICTKCGQRFSHEREEYLRDAIRSHSCGAAIVRIVEWSSEGSDAQILECPHCEQTWLKGEEVISAPHISLYAATTILVEELKRALDEPLKGTGFVNKLLCFSDGRQQAAAIAARLQRTNADFTFRQLLYRALSNGPLGTKQIISQLTETISEDRGLAALFCEREEVDDFSAIRNRVATQLFVETCSEYRTLEALGIVNVSIPKELEDAAESSLRSDGLFSRLGESDRRSFFALLLHWNFRSRRWAVHRGSLPLFYQDLEAKGFQERSVSLFGNSEANLAGFSLKRANSRNRAFDYYKRVCERVGSSIFTGQLSDFQRVTESLWKSILNAKFTERERLIGPPMTSCFVATELGDNSKVKLNWFALLWRLIDPNSVLFCCDTCNAHSVYSTQGVCPIRSCSGSLIASSLKDLEQDEFRPTRHYIRLLRDKEPKPLNVEEHTAQISAKTRREIERSFKLPEAGSVDVISGSTTFEMGVDLGSLNAVFLANMPPEVSNYRQRAGRAGRRQGMLPVVFTYVRERPHDAYFWSRPKVFISGPVRVPRFRAPSHEVLLRHANAVIYADVSKRHPEQSRLEGPPIEAFMQLACGDGERRRLAAAARDTTTELYVALQSVLTTNKELQITPPFCVEKFFERLEHFREAYLDENTGEGSITVLSDYGILPSYSYPIYVDELRLVDYPASVWPRASLKLQRDRSIALREYFPGRTLIANKVGLRSVGVWSGYRTQTFQFCRQCSFIDMKCEYKECLNGCGPMVAQKALRPLGGFIGKYDPNLSRSESDLFAISGGQYLFDPANNPPPPLALYGEAILAARQSSFNIDKSGARMRTFTPRPDYETPLALARSQIVDRAAPRKGAKDCLVLPEMGVGTPERFYLMHEFTTDIVRLQVQNSRAGQRLFGTEAIEARLKNADEPTQKKIFEMYRYTLAQALCTGGARLLGINPSDLAFTFRQTQENAIFRKEFIVFDTAPGGAGYCDQLLEVMPDWFAAAADVLDCACGDSCYSCLRSYENQQLHAWFDRLLIRDGLRVFNASNWKVPSSGAAAGRS